MIKWEIYVQNRALQSLQVWEINGRTVQIAAFTAGLEDGEGY